MKGIKEQAIRGVVLVGRAALFCMGVFAVLAMAVAVAVLIPVMLVATMLPTTVVGPKRVPSVEQSAGNASEVRTPRMAMAKPR